MKLISSILYYQTTTITDDVSMQYLLQLVPMAFDQSGRYTKEQYCRDISMVIKVVDHKAITCDPQVVVVSVPD